jgi:hypothetical protein
MLRRIAMLRKKDIHAIAQEKTTSPIKSHGADLQQIRGARELRK